MFMTLILMFKSKIFEMNDRGNLIRFRKMMLKSVNASLNLCIKLETPEGSKSNFRMFVENHEGCWMNVL